MDMGGGYGRGQDPAMEAAGGSERATATKPGTKELTEARDADSKKCLGAAHGVASGAKVGTRTNSL